MTDHTEGHLLQKPVRTTTWPNVQVHYMLKNDIELLWRIRSSADCDEN